MSQVTIIQELQQAASVLERVMASPELLSKVEQAAQMMSASVKQGGKIISCGNGGSHCDAMHFAEELTGKYREPRQAIPAMIGRGQLDAVMVAGTPFVVKESARRLADERAAKKSAA